jgi:hypothetical protein
MIVKGMFIILWLSLSSFFVKAQESYKMKSENQDMSISGTSTLHKWTMNTKKVNGGAQFGFIPGHHNQLASVQSLTMSLEVISLKSKDKSLDKNAYKALKTDQFKDISYTLTAATVLPSKNNKYKIATTGNLEIAGVKNKIHMDVYCTVNDDTSITCTGTDALKMTDYNVKPPSFMLGAMKTGDELTLDFTVVYKK